jgi:hypothetical protein
MTNALAINYVWLYLASSEREGEDAIAQLAQALSIPSRQVFSGEGLQIDDRLTYMQDSTLIHFLVQGDFAYSCDVQLAGWTLPDVEVALDKLAASGLTLAMLNDSNASPFACILFQAGSRSAVTVVGNDDTGIVTMYPAS